MFDKLMSIFADASQDRAQAQREALAELLVWAMYADGHLSLDEKDVLDREMTAVAWDSDKPLSAFLLMPPPKCDMPWPVKARRWHCSARSPNAWVMRVHASPPWPLPNDWPAVMPSSPAPSARCSTAPASVFPCRIDSHPPEDPMIRSFSSARAAVGHHR